MKESLNIARSRSEWLESHMTDSKDELKRLRVVRLFPSTVILQISQPLVPESLFIRRKFLTTELFPPSSNTILARSFSSSVPSYKPDRYSRVGCTLYKSPRSCDLQLYFSICRITAVMNKHFGNNYLFCPSHRPQWAITMCSPCSAFIHCAISKKHSFSEKERHCQIL